MPKAAVRKDRKPAESPAQPAVHDEPLLARIAAPLLILLIGTAAYWNSFRGGYVLDDAPNITDSIEIRGLWPTKVTMLGPPWTSYTGRPVAMFFLALSYRIHGLDPLGYHIFNLAVHLTAALALYGIVRRTLLLPRLQPRFTGRERILAAIVATIWVVHPLTTSAVTYISQRVESMMGMFYLLTIYTFIRAILEPLRGKRTVWQILSVFFCLLGMFTKEPMVTAPIVALLYDRTLVSGSFSKAMRQHGVFLSCLAATWVPLGILLSMHPHGNAVGYHFSDFTALDYLKTQTKSIVMYLKLSIWPSPLVVYYGTADHDLPVLRAFWQYAPWGAIVVALLALTTWGLIRGSALALLGAAFFLILAPSSSIMPMPSEMFAEHRMYLPLVTVVALVVLGVYALGSLAMNQRTKLPAALSRVGWIVPGCVILALAVATYRRNELYSSPIELWRDARAKRPDSPTVLGELGRLESLAGNFPQAEQYFREALARWPEYPIALIAYGRMLEQMNRIPEAIHQYQLACTYAADDISGGFIYFADLLSKHGQRDQAIELLQIAVKKNPNHPIARSLLGALLIRAGRVSAGEAEFNEVFRLVPNTAYAHLMIADALSGQGLLDLCEQHLRQARALTPRDPGIALRLGVLEGSRGRFADAANEYRAGLEIDPEQISLLNNLAWIYATAPDPALRNGKEAVRLAERAVRLSKDNIGAALDTLAAAYAEDGQFDKAVETMQKALSMTSDAQVRDQGADMRARLELYKQHKPFRDQPAPTATQPG